MNNPGNLAKPGRRVIAKIIGYAQRTSDPHSVFCISGNREAGEKARIGLLKEVYGKSTIAATLAKHAPKSDGNDTEGYINYLCEKAKVPRSTVINDMTPAQFDTMVKALEVKEGNRAEENMKSVRELNFMYEAEPAEKAVQNDYFKTVMHANRDPQDLTSFYAAVVGARLSEKLTVKNPFTVGAEQVSLKITYPKSKTSVQYEFRVNDTSVKFSHASTSAE